MVDFPTPDGRTIERWLNAVQFLGVPTQVFSPKVRTVSDQSGKSGYLFGLILNESRSKRPLDSEKNKANCPLCASIEETKDEPARRIDSGSELAGYIVVPNLFPLKLGHSLAITEKTRSSERPMYNTKNLDWVAEEMKKIFDYCERIGFQAFHNGEGCGASIPNHEHWHITNWHATFSTAGEVYGFEGSETKKTKLCSVRKMPEFPFAHLIFRQDEPDRIVDFLDSLQREIGERFEKGFVPHLVCQGRLGVLVAPCKNYMASGGIGSGDVAGHIPVKSKDDFERIDYAFCLEKLRRQLFTKEEINLERLI